MNLKQACIFMPHHKMAWAYSVNLLCHSVINDFQFVISATVGHIQLKFNI